MKNLSYEEISNKIKTELEKNRKINQQRKELTITRTYIDDDPPIQASPILSSREKMRRRFKTGPALSDDEFDNLLTEHRHGMAMSFLGCYLTYDLIDYAEEEVQI